MHTLMLVFTLVLALGTPALAQEWTEYRNIQDGFQIAFPGQPQVTETTWKSEFGYVLPARVYTVALDRERYSLTVADYSAIERQGLARFKTCPAGAEPCLGSVLSGPGYWKHDVRGALVYATSKFLQGNAKVTHYLWNHQDLVEGQELQLTNPDESRTLVFVAMHEMRLYVMEGTVAKGRPEPGLFQNSIVWLDKDGNGIRYQTIYANQFYGLKELPTPARAGAGRGAGAAPQGPGGGGQR